MKVGFIGLGIMGKPMARNLIKAGYQLTVYDIVPELIAELEASGAGRADELCRSAFVRIKEERNTVDRQCFHS